MKQKKKLSNSIGSFFIEIHPKIARYLQVYLTSSHFVIRNVENMIIEYEGRRHRGNRIVNNKTNIVLGTLTLTITRDCPLLENIQQRVNFESAMYWHIIKLYEYCKVTNSLGISCYFCYYYVLFIIIFKIDIFVFMNK